MEKIIQVIAAPKKEDGKNAYIFIDDESIEEVEYFALLADGTLRPMQAKIENGYFNGYELAKHDENTFRGMEANEQEAYSFE